MKSLLTAAVLGTVTAGLVYTARNKNKAPKKETAKVVKATIMLSSSDIVNRVSEFAVEVSVVNNNVTCKTVADRDTLSLHAKSLLLKFSEHVEAEIKDPAYGTFTLSNACSSFVAKFPSFRAYVN